MVAKYDYDVYTNSPNSDAVHAEMSFRRGDEIIVFGGGSSLRIYILISREPTEHQTYSRSQNHEFVICIEQRKINYIKE